MREYIVFERLADGGMLDAGIVRGLRNARRRVQQLTETSRSEYYVFDLWTGGLVLHASSAKSKRLQSPRTKAV